ncbi:Rna recognition motif-containing protein [Cardiosporidium cionae]|uniref:Rna recognition motif-containing protein n=1 Tax=Cardiosporidium cionae TaxID=476202 RepID=A0ABQ7J7T2_9APIC|nr:Rna recognition motif-containing protein [Cardiosporidium cionae]|eukprot:KAF8820008.1 Rna recognition motif-containing protein [Cardiosporidium cionae]
MNVNEKLNLSLDDLISLKHRTSSSNSAAHRPTSTAKLAPPPHARPAFRPIRRQNAQDSSTPSAPRTLLTHSHPYAKTSFVSKAGKSFNSRFSTDASRIAYNEVDPENEEEDDDSFMSETCSVTVSGVQGLSEASIRKIFQMCGTVLRVRFISMETALVDLDERSVRYPSLDMLDGYDIDGTKLHLDSIASQSNIPPLRHAQKEIGNGNNRHIGLLPGRSLYADGNVSSQSSATKTVETTNITMSENAASHTAASIIVSNIPVDLTAQDVQEAFSVVGTVKKTEILLNSSGEHTGRVAVLFTDSRAAEEAVRRFDGGDLNEHTIRVFLE